MLPCGTPHRYLVRRINMANTMCVVQHKYDLNKSTEHPNANFFNPRLTFFLFFFWGNIVYPREGYPRFSHQNDRKGCPKDYGLGHLLFGFRVIGNHPLKEW